MLPLTGLGFIGGFCCYHNVVPMGLKQFHRYYFMEYSTYTCPSMNYKYKTSSFFAPFRKGATKKDQIRNGILYLTISYSPILFMAKSSISTEQKETIKAEASLALVKIGIFLSTAFLRMV